MNSLRRFAQHFIIPEPQHAKPLIFESRSSVATRRPKRLVSSTSLPGFVQRIFNRIEVRGHRCAAPINRHGIKDSKVESEEENVMKRREFLKTAGAGLAASTAVAAPAIAQSMPELKWRCTTS